MPKSAAKVSAKEPVVQKGIKEPITKKEPAKPMKTIPSMEKRANKFSGIKKMFNRKSPEQ
jgi:hypothetical protein